MQRTIRLWLEDKPGALMRVAGLVTGTGSNIVSLNVAPDPWQPGVSRMTLTADLEPRLHSLVVAKMNRLVNVLAAIDVTGEFRGPRPATRFGSRGGFVEAAAGPPLYSPERQPSGC